MAWLIGPDDVFEVTIFSSFLNQVSANVLAYKVSSVSVGEVQPYDMAVGYWDSVDELYAECMSFNAVALGVKLRDLTPGNTNAPVYYRSDEDGTITGDPLPGQISGLISWRTALIGKKGIGRSYIPFPAESDNQVSTTPSNNYIDRLTNLAGTLIGPGFTAGDADVTLALQIHNRQEATFQPVTSYITRRAWATQRRRGSFGRPNAIPF